MDNSTGILLYIVECHCPNNGEDDSNGKEDQPRHEDVAIAALLCLLELTGPVVGIQLMLCSAHRDKSKHDISDNKSDTYERSLAADVHHTRKQRHQYAGDEEGIRQDLNIDRHTVGEKAL